MAGLFGILKYILDRTAVENAQNYQEAVRAALKNCGKLNWADQNKLALDVGARLWSNMNDNPSLMNVTLISRIGASISSFYCYMTPGFVGKILFIPTYILTLPIHFVVGNQKLDLVRVQTRRMVVKGLWSLAIPMGIAILLAAILVQKVHYVQVVNGQGPEGPKIEKHTIKRVAIGTGPFLFALPYHPIIYFFAYTLILFAVFQNFSFFLLLVNYGDEV